jgi:hypothetical protein
VLKLFILACFWLGTLSGEEYPPIKGWGGVRYRSDNLTWASDAPDCPSPLSKARWHNIGTAEVLLGAAYGPFKFHKRIFSPEMRSFLQSISLVIDGGILLPLAGGGSTFRLQEDLCSGDRQQKRGRRTHIRGGECEILLSQENRLNSSCSAFLLIGYGCQGRRLKTPLCQGDKLFADGTEVAIDKIAYNAFWHGPWVGVGFKSTVTPSCILFADGQWHRWIFRGHSHFDINERYTDMFELNATAKLLQKGIADGYKFKAGLSYTLGICLNAFLYAGWEGFHVHNGTSKNHMKNLLHTPWKTVVGSGSYKRAGAKESIRWCAWFISGGFIYDF